MIRHIFRIIWNERKVNIWIMLEYILVFCVLWFCCDFLWFMGKNMLEDPGMHIEQTYLIKMGKRDMTQDETEDRAAQVQLFTERVRRFPGVESIAFSRSAIPYTYNNTMNGYMVNRDSVWTSVWQSLVTPGFFDVYRMKLASGRTFEENDLVTGRNIILSPNREGMIGEYERPTFPVNDVRILGWHFDKPEEDFYVVGVYDRVKRFYSEPFRSTVYQYLNPKNTDLAHVDISIRVNADAGHDFAEKFVARMREQLFIGPYFLVSVVPSELVKKEALNTEVNKNVNSVLAITGFLMVNIFLGLIGTFWTRTQSRRSEIGLRIALGASQRNVQWMMFAETFIMLFLASILSTYICLNLAQTEILSSLGIPLAERENAGIGNEQDAINYLVTFGFLAIVSCLAVWYPARKSSVIAPAEALRDE